MTGTRDAVRQYSFLFLEIKKEKVGKWRTSLFGPVCFSTWAAKWVFVHDPFLMDVLIDGFNAVILSGLVKHSNLNTLL